MCVDVFLNIDYTHILCIIPKLQISKIVNQPKIMIMWSVFFFSFTFTFTLDNDVVLDLVCHVYIYYYFLFNSFYLVCAFELEQPLLDIIKAIMCRSRGEQCSIHFDVPDSLERNGKWVDDKKPIRTLVQIRCRRWAVTWCQCPLPTKKQKNPLSNKQHNSNERSQDAGCLWDD